MNKSLFLSLIIAVNMVSYPVFALISDEEDNPFDEDGDRICEFDMEGGWTQEECDELATDDASQNIFCISLNQWVPADKSCLAVEVTNCGDSPFRFECKHKKIDGRPFQF